MMCILSLSHVLKNVKRLALTHAQLVAQTCPTEDNTIFDRTCHFERWIQIHLQLTICPPPLLGGIKTTSYKFVSLTNAVIYSHLLGPDCLLFVTSTHVDTYTLRE